MESPFVLRLSHATHIIDPDECDGRDLMASLVLDCARLANADHDAPDEVHAGPALVEFARRVHANGAAVPDNVDELVARLRAEGNVGEVDGDWGALRQAVLAAHERGLLGGGEEAQATLWFG